MKKYETPIDLLIGGYKDGFLECIKALSSMPSNDVSNILNMPEHEKEALANHALEIYKIKLTDFLNKK